MKLVRLRRPSEPGHRRARSSAQSAGGRRRICASRCADQPPRRSNIVPAFFALPLQISTRAHELMATITETGCRRAEEMAVPIRRIRLAFPEQDLAQLVEELSLVHLAHRDRRTMTTPWHSAWPPPRTHAQFSGVGDTCRHFAASWRIPQRVATVIRSPRQAWCRSISVHRRSRRTRRAACGRRGPR